MNDSLWIVVVVTMAFIGFLMGYSLPPLVDAGMIAGMGHPPAASTEVQKDMEHYYQNLLEDN